MTSALGDNCGDVWSEGCTTFGTKKKDTKRRSVIGHDVQTIITETPSYKKGRKKILEQSFRIYLTQSVRVKVGGPPVGVTQN